MLKLRVKSCISYFIYLNLQPRNRLHYSRGYGRRNDVYCHVCCHSNNLLSICGSF